jgi:uncharacterized protein (DUF1697 family)
MTYTVFVVLFRGVGGKTQLPTALLREKLSDAGFANVATYINSGNAVLRTELSRDTAVEKIAAICSKNFGFDKQIHAVSRSEWSALIDNNPFGDATSKGNLLHAAWLGAAPDTGAIDALSALAVDGDRFAVVGNVAYLHTPRGFSKSQLAAKFDKGIGVPNTARNWNTVVKLAQLAGEAAKA